MLHGRTGDENSMWVFADKFPDDVSLVVPRAPHPASPRGYSWTPPGIQEEQRAGLDDLRDSATAVVSMLDAFATQQEIRAEQFDVIGFSQGAALACSVALEHPHRIRRLAMLAGFVPRGAEGIIASQPLKGIPVFVAHGTQDELVAIDLAHKSMALLERAEAQLTYCEAQIGHKVSAACLRELQKFFA
jgi:phospholipase/carboxylesterase